ncbi:MAG: DUF4345 family protein [Pseudomonadota bacterium]
MTLAKVTLWLFGLITLAFGVWSLFAPESLAALIKWGIVAPASITEIRAFYGGVEIGLAAFWIAGALKPDLTRGALLSMLLVWGMVVISRGAGIILDDSYSSTMLGALIAEVAAAVMAFISLRRLPASRGSLLS